MQDTKLFQLALGLTTPWTVTRADFDAAAKRLDICIDFPAGSRFTCPGCGAGDCPVHDTERMRWRHLDFFQHQAHLHARVPRVRCDRCGVKTVAVPWARPGSGFTLLFEALVMTLVRAMPVNAAARLVGEHDTRLWRVIHHYVEQARVRQDVAEVKRVAIDETAARRGHDYVSLFVDIDRARMLFATAGKDATTVNAFASDLRARGGDPEAIEEVCIDISPAFIRGTVESLPEAAVTFDKFHAVKIVNDAVDQVRRAEQKTQPLLKGTRYLWLRNPTTLSRRQQAAFAQLPKRHLKTARAYQMITLLSTSNSEEPFYLTSLVMLAVLMGLVVRSHWSVENSLHWVMDMVFRDDECRVRTEHAPANFCTIKHMAQNLLRKAPGKDFYG